MADQTGYANHPIVQGMRNEYAALGAASTEAATAQDALALALSALLQVDSDDALAQALAEHSILHEARSCSPSTVSSNQALADQERETVTRLGVLLRCAHGALRTLRHAEQIDAESHAAVIDLWRNRSSPGGTARRRPGDGAAPAGRQACITLGNRCADTVEDSGAGGARRRRPRPAPSSPTNAMLLRNRAGVHIDRGDLSRGRHRGCGRARTGRAAPGRSTPQSGCRARPRVSRL